MPFYDYKCARCHERFEAEQKITEIPLTKCPACGGPARRVISRNVGLVFKGSGFHCTDYRKDKKEAPKKDTKPPASEKSPEKKK